MPLPGRAWIVRHALRSAVKRGERAALEVLGFGKKAQVALGPIQISPARAVIGGSVRIGFALTSTHTRGQRVLVDLAVHYVKASGQTSVKVFKLKTLGLAPGQTATLAKTLSLKEMSTRKHYPGLHRVDVILSGEAQSLGGFELLT